jgi:hypothetical protein
MQVRGASREGWKERNELGAARGMRVRTHRELRSFMESLARLEKESYYAASFSDAERMHANFYDDFLGIDEVQGHIERTQELIRRLDALTQAIMKEL